MTDWAGTQEDQTSYNDLIKENTSLRHNLVNKGQVIISLENTIEIKDQAIAALRDSCRVKDDMIEKAQKIALDVIQKAAMPHMMLVSREELDQASMIDSSRYARMADMLGEPHKRHHAATALVIVFGLIGMALGYAIGAILCL